MDGPKVFADITFIINFTMDFIILWATAKISGVRPVYSRIGLAAFLGGIYSIGYLFPELDKWYTLHMKVAFSCIMVVIGLWPSNWANFKKVLLYFYGINFTVAGASIAASYLFSVNNAQITFSYFWLLGGVFCAIGIGVFGDRYLVQRVIPNLLNFNVELHFDRVSCNGKGFLDTGNGLRDPLTNKPVIVAEYTLLRSCMPEDFIIAFESNIDESDMLDALTQTSWANRLRLIPFTSIGKKNGILVGIRADEIIVKSNLKQVFFKNVVVGIYRDRLGMQNNYQLLIPSEIVQNEGG